MYILLEPGMKIKVGDEFYIDENEGWVNPFIAQIGRYYRADKPPFRRKITTIKELVEVLGDKKKHK